MRLSVERNLIISLLKHTNCRPILLEVLIREAKTTAVSSEEYLEKMQNEGLIRIYEDTVEAEPNGRIELAIKAVQLGFDVKTVSSYLRWQEFENIASFALQINGYTTKQNLHFKHNNKRWEIDVVGCRKPNVVCVDCKQYHHGLQASTLKKMVTAQIRRVEAFAQSLPNQAIEIDCTKWAQAKFIPAIISLTEGSPKIFDGVPVVPVMQLQDFINQLPAYADSLKHFRRDFKHL